MLRSRPAPIRRPTYRPTPVRTQLPIRPRYYAQQSNVMKDLGREMNELTGLEARARTELSDLQRQKLMKKAEKMNDGAAQARLQEETRTADPNAGMFGAAPERATESKIDEQLEDSARKLKRTGNTEAAGRAYAKFDKGENKMFESMPAEKMAVQAATKMKAAKFGKAKETAEVRSPPGNFEGNMGPTEGMHDEAEELAGTRRPGLRGSSGPRSDEAARKDEENVLARSAEEEARRESKVFNKVGRKVEKNFNSTIADKVAPATEGVMPKVVAGASMLKEKLSDDVIPKVMEAATTLKNKAMDLATAAKERLTDPANVNESERKLRRTVSEGSARSWNERVEDLKERAEEKAEDLKESAKDKAESWTEAAKDTASAVKEKAQDIAGAAKEKIGRTMSADNVREMKYKAEEAKDTAESWAESAKEKAGSWTEAAKNTAKDIATAAKEKAEVLRDDIVDSGKYNKKPVAPTNTAKDITYGTVAEDIKEAAIATKDAVVGVAGAAMERVQESMHSGVLHDASEKAKDMAGMAKEKISRTMSSDNVRDAKYKAAELKEKAEDKAEDLKEKAESWADEASAKYGKWAADAKEKLEESSESGTLRNANRKAAEMKEKAKDKAERWTEAAEEKAEDLAENVKSKAGSWTESAKDTAYAAKDKAMDLAGAAKEKVQESMQSGMLHDAAEKAKDIAGVAKEKIIRTMSSDNLRDMKYKAAELKDKAEDKADAIAESWTEESHAAHNASDFVANAKAKTKEFVADAKDKTERWVNKDNREKIGQEAEPTWKGVGETLAPKLAGSAHSMRVVAQEKLAAAAHNIHERTADAPAAWRDESRDEEWQKLKSSASVMAGSVSAIVTEKLRQGVHVAAGKMEEVLATNPADAVGTKTVSGFDLREENRKVEETASDALFREAEEARKKVNQKQKQRRPEVRA